jgi:hypothetical protein
LNKRLREVKDLLLAFSRADESEATWEKMPAKSIRQLEMQDQIYLLEYYNKHLNN